MPESSGLSGQSDLVSRNRDAFRRHHPKVWEMLERIGVPGGRAIEQDGRTVNIDLGGVTLYPEAAETWTAGQLERFFAAPDRIGFRTPANCNLSPISRRVLKDITEYFVGRLPGPLPDYPQVDVGYAFILGVGLGHVVVEFLRRNLVRRLILVEPVADFLVHSLKAVDWEEIFQEADAKNVSLHFLIGGTPVENVRSLLSLIQELGQTFLEGSYAFLGYYSWEVTETRAQLNEKLQVLFLSSGFFEDELLMTGHTYLNLKRFPFRLIDRRPHMHQEVPVFVVGSGPSLDQALPVIKKWRDRAIVFSCGTSIGILLKNGIRPDLHNENENTPQLVKNLSEFAAEYGFDGITLVASTTVDPRVPALFGNRWFYFRPQLSSAYLLRGKAEPIVGPGPLVANAAYAAMATLGFRNIYLFGVDCGRRADSGHHAKDAVYYEEDYDNYLPGEGLELLETEFTRSVPGNFGGEALTTWYLDMSRAAFASAQKVFQANLVNCGNGARIDGAKPRHPASLSFAGPAGGAPAALAAAERQMVGFAAGAYLADLGLERHRDASSRFAAAFNPTIDAALREDREFSDVERRLYRFARENAPDHWGVFAMIEGTYRSLIRLGAFGGTRIADPDERKRFLDFFLERYREACLWMAKEAGTMLGEIADGADDLSGLQTEAPA